MEVTILFTNFKKYFLVFLFASIIVPAYSMDEESIDFSWQDIFPSFIVVVVGFPAVYYYKQYCKRKLNSKLIDKFKIARKSGFSKDTNQKISDLLKQGADPNMKCKMKYDIIIPLICFAAVNGSVDVINLLLKNGVDVNDVNNVNKDLTKPLAWAIIYGQSEAVGTLCDAGASLVNINNLGNNAFYYAINRDAMYKNIYQNHSKM